MKSAYPILTVGDIYETMDGIQMEVTYCWNDGSHLMKHLNGERKGWIDCMGGWNVYVKKIK